MKGEFTMSERGCGFGFGDDWIWIIIIVIIIFCCCGGGFFGGCRE
jgi:hypothetical protein